MHQLDKLTGIAEECFGNAVKFLNIRDHSEFELKAKLKKKGFNSSQVDYAIKKCMDYGYLDDEKFALKYFETLKLKLNGHLKIKSELYKKKIHDDLIDKIITDYLDSGDEYQIGRKYFEKIKYKLEKKKDYKKRSDSYFRTMSQRGFSRTVIFEILDENYDFFKNENFF